MQARQLELIWQSLPVLLHLFWGMSSGAAVLALAPLPYLQGFRNAVLLSACRGKMWEDRPRNALGRFTDWRVPQAWFGHFYVIGILASALTLSLVYRQDGMAQGPLILSLSLLLLHLTRRCLETQYMMRYPAGSNMHAIAYAFGLAYYIVLPLTCLPPDFFQGQGAFGSQNEDAFATRAHVYVYPNTRQKWHHSHLILARLSRQKGQKEEAYQIPSGWAFELVSCPHYLGEMVIYLGLALMLDSRRIIAWLPLIWVVANLLLASGPTHSWYRRKFEDYPRSRKAVIPFIY